MHIARLLPGENIQDLVKRKQTFRFPNYCCFVGRMVKRLILKNQNIDKFFFISPSFFIYSFVFTHVEYQPIHFKTKSLSFTRQTRYGGGVLLLLLEVAPLLKHLHLRDNFLFRGPLSSSLTEC